MDDFSSFVVKKNAAVQFTASMGSEALGASHVTERVVASHMASSSDIVVNARVVKNLFVKSIKRNWPSVPNAVGRPSAPTE